MDPNAVVPAPEPMPPMPMGEAPAPPNGAVVGQPAPGPAPRVPMDRTKAKQDLIFNAVIFGAAVVVLGLIFGIAKWWARRQADDCESPSMSLSSFREMYDNGELSEEEYRQIRDKMASKMKGSLGLRLPAAEPPKPVGREETPPAPENPT